MIPRAHGFLCVVFATVGISGCAERVPWRSDWQRAMVEAQFDRKWAILMFSASVCPRCWKMDKEVFKDARVREAMSDYVLIRVDLPTHPDLAKQYGFDGTPSFVVFDAVGRAVGRQAGAMTSQEFVRFLGQSRLNR